MIALTEYLLSALLLVGTFFILIGAFGLVKLSDFFKRLHAPTKASTLGWAACCWHRSAITCSWVWTRNRASC